MNTLASKLATVCRDHLLREKWLIAPSRRIGHQWLDCLVLGGESVVNVHIGPLEKVDIGAQNGPIIGAQADPPVKPCRRLAVAVCSSHKA